MVMKNSDKNNKNMKSSNSNSNKQPSPPPPPTPIPGGSIKLIIAKSVFLSVGFQLLYPRLWPYGMAQPWIDRPKYIPVDMENDSLQFKHGRSKKIYERIEENPDQQNRRRSLLKGHETIIFDNDGTMYAMTEDGFLLTVTDIQQDKNDDDRNISTAKVTLIADLGLGRPLGGKFTPPNNDNDNDDNDNDNTLYIADAHLGLTRLKLGGDRKNDNNNHHYHVELVASRVYDENKWTQILYANDVTIAKKSGIVYFTDSTDIAPDRIGTRSWDTMYGCKSDALRAKKTGRLLSYDPKTDEVTVLAKNLHFPNGIALDHDETNIYFAETLTLKILKYNLQSKSLRVVNNEEEDGGGGLTGYPDGMDCSLRRKDSSDDNLLLCYAVMPSAMIPLMKGIMKLPHPLDMYIRSLIMALPKALAPPIKAYGGIAEINPSTGKIRYIQDPTGTDIIALAGVTVFNDKLYLGSLHNDYIAVYDL